MTQLYSVFQKNDMNFDKNLIYKHSKFLN